MGFTVYYRSTEPVSAALRSQVNATTDVLCEARTWLSCEPVWFFANGGGNGFLEGGSKPNFAPHPDDVAEAEAEGIADGTIQDVMDLLCELSREFGIDWQFSHDHDRGPIGFIRDGHADADLCNEIETIAMLAGTCSGDLQSTPPLNPHARSHRRDIEDHRQDDDGEEPRILKFPSLD
jgi:hypothetical protein